MAGETLCAICGKPQAARFKPFCSARCADIDLNRWLKGSYSIPGKPVEEEEDGERSPRGNAAT
jgi:endogenous inhibitor of DNA gyrase (YacG/DUF329 family)